jgi:hypothetical protein
MNNIAIFTLLLVILGLLVACLIKITKKSDGANKSSLQVKNMDVPVNPNISPNFICMDDTQLCKISLALSYYNISVDNANSIMNYLLSPNGNVVTLYKLIIDLPKQFTLPDGSGTVISKGTPTYLLWPCPDANTLLPYAVSSTQQPVCPF